MPKMKRGCCRLLAVILCVLLFNPPLWSMQGPGLRIVVVAGDDYQNIVNEIPPEPFAVRVLDGADLPVVGASVVFVAPPNGPTGTFPTGTTFTTLTDENGQARGVLFRPNAIEGAYEVQVRAEYMGQAATGFVRQRNIRSRGSGSKLFVILAVAGGAAGAAYAVVGRNKDEGRPTPPTPPSQLPGITFGGATIGGQ